MVFEQDRVGPEAIGTFLDGSEDACFAVGEGPALVLGWVGMGDGCDDVVWVALMEIVGYVGAGVLVACLLWMSSATLS